MKVIATTLAIAAFLSGLMLGQYHEHERLMKGWRLASTYYNRECYKHSNPKMRWCIWPRGY